MVVESKATRLSIPAGTSMDDQQEETVLGTSPSPFRLLYPQDEIDQFYSQDPFFYQDDKTFFVEPEKEPVKDKWHDGNKASPDWLLQQIVH